MFTSPLEYLKRKKLWERVSGNTDRYQIGIHPGHDIDLSRQVLNADTSAVEQDVSPQIKGLDELSNG